MQLKAALRWTAIYRGVTWASGLVFLGLLGVAVYLGLDVTLAHLADGNLRAPLRRPGTAMVAAQAVLVLLGFVQWQLVKTLTYFKTLTEATEEQMAERFDSEKVKSEVLEVLDDRLAEMQTELERTRKEVQQIDGGGPTTQSPSAGNTGDASSAGGFDFEG